MRTGSTVFTFRVFVETLSPLSAPSLARGTRTKKSPVYISRFTRGCRSSSLPSSTSSIIHLRERAGGIASSFIVYCISAGRTSINAGLTIVVLAHDPVEDDSRMRRRLCSRDGAKSSVTRKKGRGTHSTELCGAKEAGRWKFRDRVLLSEDDRPCRIVSRGGRKGSGDRLRRARRIEMRVTCLSRVPLFLAFPLFLSRN